VLVNNILCFGGDVFGDYIYPTKCYIWTQKTGFMNFQCEISIMFRQYQKKELEGISLGVDSPKLVSFKWLDLFFHGAL
jgi:uncharacterized membrane protein